jgi:hypothetical protein
VVRYGRTVPRGFLSVYSVDTEAEAKMLLTLACPTNLKGDFVAPELVQSQTIENLLKFGDRLAKAHRMMKAKEKRRGEEEADQENGQTDL